MAGLELLPFADEHLDEAARLLAARHARHRAAEPLLRTRFEDPAAARSEIEATWREGEPSGAVALRDGRLFGYLFGAPRPQPSWGPNVWVELVGHAVEEAEVVRDLYGLAAQSWVDDGRTRHYALVPAADGPLVDAWFRLGFGQQHALAVREVPDEQALPQGFSVRLAGPADLDAIVELDLLEAHQIGSPVFSGLPPTPREEARRELAEELAGGEATCVLAERDGRAVGCAAVAPIERSGMHNRLAQVEQACILGYAATLPETRGTGAGLAVTEGVFRWAREQGYGAVVVDWRVTNLLASRFWQGRGFRTTFLRLYRSIP
jgi:GNAT superfamily N-acetyltransferase